MDKLQLFRGQDYIINEHITIHHPTINEICDYGEKEYYSMVSNLISIPSDLKGQLYNIGIDYEEIDEFSLFAMLCKSMDVESTRILFKDLDLSKLTVATHKKTQEMVLYDSANDFLIDKVIYTFITDYIRQIHGIEKKVENAGNAITKQILIDEAVEKLKDTTKQKDKSMLIPLISAMTNCSEFKYNHSTVWDLPIYVFMDSVKRIQKIKNYTHLMQGAYSGTVDLSKVSKKELNWLEELD